MATVIRHAVGSTVDDSTNGISYRERTVVKGVVGADYLAALNAALADIGVPAKNSTIVVSSTTLSCTNRRVVGVHNEPGGTARVTLELLFEQVSSTINVNPSDIGPGLTTIGSVVEVVQTFVDKDGNDITTREAVGEDEVGGSVSFRRPRAIIQFSRWEVSSPRSRAEAFVGKTNSGTWNGYSTNFVLCSSITGTSRDSGATYDVEYSFEVAPDSNGWDATVVHRDTKAGRPVFPLVDGVSKKDVALYDSVSFSPMSISL